VTALLLTGLACALGAAVSYGVASVLQAVGARGTRRTDSLDPRLLVRLAGTPTYVVGLALDVAGFGLTLVAARTLPLFVVQAVVAGFVAVTAVLGAVFLQMPLRRSDRFGLALVLTGLVLVCLSATGERPVPVSGWWQWALLGGVVLLLTVGHLLGRLQDVRGALALGVVAGLAFGATSTAARMVPAAAPQSSPGVWLLHAGAQPATWAMVLAGGLGMLAYASALQRGSVTQATAPLVVAETVAPALFGFWVLGDQARPGWEWIAVSGFVVAVAGALVLARHAEIPDRATPTPLERTA